MVITGDLIDKGGTSFLPTDNPYEILHEEFIRPLLTELSIDVNHLFIIPGNHDIQESKIEDISEDGILNFRDVDRIDKYIDQN